MRALSRSEDEARPSARPEPPTDLPVAGEKYENATVTICQHFIFRLLVFLFITSEPFIVLHLIIATLSQHDLE